MTEELLNHAQIGAALEHVCRTRVAQRVRMQVAAPRAESSILAHEVLDLADAEATAVAPEQQRARILRARLRVTEQRPQREIFVVRALTGASDGNEALLAPLAEHGERAGVEPQRLAVERRELVHAQAATIQQLEDQLVAAPARTLDGVAV